MRGLKMKKIYRIILFPIYVLLNFSVLVKKKRLLFCLLSCMVLFHLIIGAAPSSSERPFPKPKGLVNDFANVIPQSYEQKIVAITSELFQKTGTSVVVVTMPDIGGGEYNDYAIRLYNAWGIGKKGENKGVSIFVTIKEREMRITTGYGIEGILTNDLAGEIRDRYIIPYLKQDKYGEGLLNGTTAVAQVIARDAGVKLIALQEQELKLALPSENAFKIIECSKSISYRAIRVDVPSGIDLSNDKTARQIMEQAAHFAQDKCPKKQPFSNISVFLCQRGQKWVRDCEVSARNYDHDKLTWREYSNCPLRERLAREKAMQRAEEQRVREERKRQEMLAKKAAEDREKAEARKRFDEFVKKYDVKDWPSKEALFANPFVYEGKTVAFVSKFETMISATEGIFEKNDEPFLVSKIPKGLFSSKVKVVIAGSVLGKKEIKLPVLGTVLVPHLKFVGVHFCKDWGCSDIIAK
ncbi:MAG: TPM domain-containing protein [Desulfobacterales bacterium]|nr:TPM domain-containing protein [Desulfobacterales bacterium]